MTTLIVVKDRAMRTVKPKVGDYTLVVGDLIPTVIADAVLVDNWYPDEGPEREWYEQVLTRLRWGGHLWIFQDGTYREWIRTPVATSPTAEIDGVAEEFAWRDVPDADAPPSPTSPRTSRTRKSASEPNSGTPSTPTPTTSEEDA